jgi:hypothetical protein
MTDQLVEIAVSTAIPILDIVCTSVSPILLVALTLIGRTYLKKRDKLTIVQNNKQDRVVADLISRILTVENICSKTADKLDVNETKEEGVKRLVKSKNYYLSKFHFSPMKTIVTGIAEKFVGTYSTITETYDIGIDSIVGINTSLNTFLSKARQIKCQHAEDTILELIREKLELHFDCLLHNVEEVLTSPENSYDKRFEKACYFFLKEFLKEMCDEDLDLIRHCEATKQTSQCFSIPEEISAPTRKRNRKENQTKSSKSVKSRRDAILLTVGETYGGKK